MAEKNEKIQNSALQAAYIHEELIKALEKNSELVAAISDTATGVTISNPRLPDNPVIYANQGFVTLTGYSLDEVLHRNCRFLQGEGTDKQTIKEIEAAIQSHKPISVELLNYRKDGTPFWNELSITPVFDEAGEILYFVGLQQDVTRRKRAEQQLQNEITFAKRIQQSVLTPPIHRERIMIDAAYIPSEQLAGDMYGWYEIDENRYGILLLDVVGHGIGASLISMSICSLLHGLITRLIDPIKVARELNRHMRNLYREEAQIIPNYFTALYAVIDLKKKEIEYVNAGHPPGIILTAGGRAEKLVEGTIPLGLLSSINIKKGRFTYRGMDAVEPLRLILYTDGLVEKEGKSTDETIAKLIAFLRDHRHADNGALIERVVAEFNQQSDTSDDICLISATIYP
ncbi:PP2C family protein-serine/threonine phosphatase [Aneurinibacillus terranovensis]|uniref:PP2C family protein-serine/threonine phosphatase n=1 Tax=Aneurinibacillus terranovensis TaxID=278991 RepID=UPI00041B1D42|nr:PP2C family protein-serine/threonine phosphatase [Aneurinibacillus terranovensis]